jgi:CheY-like chemotaxis protein
MGVELLRMKVEDPASREILETVQQSARRGTTLVKQVLSFARGAEGARVAVDLSAVAREVQAFARSTFPKNIVFNADIPADGSLVEGDPTQINQVLLNLCVNARDAMPRGGILNLKARNLDVDQHYAAMNRSLPPGRYVALEVTDTGTGMPRDVLEHIFEPFFTTKEPGKGTGLGLSTVNTIVRAHGGCVGVESEPGRGTTFRLFLPAKANPPEAEAAEAPPEPPPGGRGELVLVVDDDTAVLSLTRVTLETFGYRVVCAKDGAEAVAIYAGRRGDVAVVLTDMVMPVMAGKALIVALRHIDPDLCIIATSGQHAGDEATSAPGITDFLAKPFTADTMLRAIDRALRKSGKLPPA